MEFFGRFRVTFLDLNFRPNPIVALPGHGITRLFLISCLTARQGTGHDHYRQQGSRHDSNALRVKPSPRRTTLLASHSSLFIAEGLSRAQRMQRIEQRGR